ncbi:MAG TPA: hypothetical protein VHW74_18760 [Mycobacteriales bacterium]|nr:hypothetical protein [Mycobacteriales bacterium]
MTRGTVYLHIGEPKCGTTFLQDVLFSHRAELAEHGVDLPGVDISDHFRAAQDILGVEQDPDDPGGLWAGSWDALAKAARTSQHKAAVITHELFCGAGDEQAARTIASLAGVDVHVIITIRDLAGLLPAEWQETVKHKNARTWQDWLGDIIDTPPRRRRPRARWFWSAHDTVRVVERWSALVGADHVHVVTVPPSSAPPDLLWRRFAKAIGAADLKIELDQTKSNQSLGVAEVEMLRRLNTRLDEMPLWFYARNVKGKLAHGLLSERGRGMRLQIPEDRHEWVRQQSTRRIRRLRASGADIIGNLQELAPPKEFPVGVLPENVTDQELLNVALDTIATMYERRYERATELPRLNRIARGAAPGILRFVPFRRGRSAAWKLAHAVGRRKS